MTWPPVGLGLWQGLNTGIFKLTWLKLTGDCIPIIWPDSVAVPDGSCRYHDGPPPAVPSSTTSFVLVHSSAAVVHSSESAAGFVPCVALCASNPAAVDCWRQTVLLERERGRGECYCGVAWTQHGEADDALPSPMPSTPGPAPHSPLF